MSVGNLFLIFVAGTLIGGCSTFERPETYWSNPTTWFSSTGDDDSATNPLESDQVAIATGDEDLKKSVEMGEEDAAARGALDDAIAPELQATARDARGKLESPEHAGLGQARESDLWQRLRRGFALDHDADNERVRDELNWYKNHPDYINRVVDRGSRYLYYILSETEKRGLPTELALLPVVESAFDPFAYSHGRAAGLWQFIPSTGKYFGLTQSWWHDDRRDVVAATDEIGRAHV